MRSHPTTEDRAPGAGTGLWVAALGGIPLWLIHLVALASLVPVVCRRPAVEWVMHGLTAGLGALTAWAMVVCLLVGWGDRDQVGPQRRFVGRFGLLIAGTNLLLIVAEGIYVPFLDSCG